MTEIVVDGIEGKVVWRETGVWTPTVKVVRRTSLATKLGQTRMVAHEALSWLVRGVRVARLGLGMGSTTKGAVTKAIGHTMVQGTAMGEATVSIAVDKVKCTK